jgi:hypothetical protein
MRDTLAAHLILLDLVVLIISNYEVPQYAVSSSLLLLPLS